MFPKKATSARKSGMDRKRLLLWVLAPQMQRSHVWARPLATRWSTLAPKLYFAAEQGYESVESRERDRKGTVEEI